MTGFQLSGPAPAHYARTLAPIMEPFVAALLDRVEPAAGDTVLDLACGTGFVARAAAPHVGPGGRVVGVDLNPGMLAVAAGGPTTDPAVGPAIEWCEGSADALPSGDGSFDVVVCQQGLQFFPDLGAALAEIVRVTRPGARVAATVWSGVQDSPYLAAQVEAISGVPGADTASLLAAFSPSADRFVQAFAGAGLAGVRADRLQVRVTVPPGDPRAELVRSLADFAAEHLLALPWTAALLGDRPDELARVGERVAALVSGEGSVTGPVTVPFGSWLVSGEVRA